MVDHLTIEFIGGKGGDGIVSFHTAKFVPKGPPDGGDGGNGGNIFLIGDRNLLTLYDLQARRRFAAQAGGNGGSKNQHGKTGEDLFIKVPLGTQARREDGSLIGDILEDGEKILVARGGRGGKGNARFKSSRNRSPKRADAGKVGQEVKVVLDLKVIADIGLIGLPNAGKSTLLNALTNATSRIGAHPFTTKEPQLGVMKVAGKSQKLKVKKEADIEEYGSSELVSRQQQKDADEDRDTSSEIRNTGLILADIPGLIEGAAQGKGLGDQFLRHVERTAVLVHLIDPTATSSMLRDYEIIREELASYSTALARKPEVVVISKADLDVPDTEQLESLTSALTQAQVSFVRVSAVTGEGIDTLVSLIVDMHSQYREAVREEEESRPVPVPQYGIENLPNRGMVVR